MTLDDARRACDEYRWVDARSAFGVLERGDLAVDDLDRFATAAYLTGSDEQGFELWGEAYRRCLDEGNVHLGALFGVRLAQGLGFKGDMPRSQGWVDRIARCLAGAEIDCVEQGHLQHLLGMGRVFGAGDLVGALEHFEHAEKIAERYGSHGLATMARIAIGRMRIYLGDPAAGIALLDEAMVSIEANELSVLMTGDAYCTVIDACAELSDVTRLRAWTASMVRWCEIHQGLVLYRGHCFIHRAEVLAIEGRWTEALDAARRACDHLARPVPSALGAAKAVEGDALRLLGRLDEADVAYREAIVLGDRAQPGLALLRAEQDEIDVAASMIRTVAAESSDPITRCRFLPAFVEIMLRAGDVARARDGADEFAGLSIDVGSQFTRVESRLATGAVDLAEGSPSSALSVLRDAFGSLVELGVGPRAAHVRRLIAEACDALGDTQTAETERRCADDAVASYRASPDRPVAEPAGLTARELEVLRAVAGGKTNRVIGEELFISEKTVASHISHIFTKTNVSSRAAATAYAYDHDLI